MYVEYFLMYALLMNYKIFNSYLQKYIKVCQGFTKYGLERLSEYILQQTWAPSMKAEMSTSLHEQQACGLNVLSAQGCRLVYRMAW